MREPIGRISVPRIPIPSSLTGEAHIMRKLIALQGLLWTLFLLQFGCQSKTGGTVTPSFRIREPEATAAFLEADPSAYLPAATKGLQVADALADPSSWEAALISVEHEFITDVRPPGAGRSRLVLHWTPQKLVARHATSHRYGGYKHDRTARSEPSAGRVWVADRCRSLLASGWSQVPEDLEPKEVELRGNRMRLTVCIRAPQGVARLTALLPFGADEQLRFEPASESAQNLLAEGDRRTQ